MIPPRVLPVLMQSSSTEGVLRRTAEKFAITRKTFRSKSDSTANHHRLHCKDVVDDKYSWRSSGEAISFQSIIHDLQWQQGTLCRLAIAGYVNDLDVFRWLIARCSSFAMLLTLRYRTYVLIIYEHVANMRIKKTRPIASFYNVSISNAKILSLVQ
ncbi:hypothetical protein [Brevibacillus agri]|uniref:hypothetical protein n=1 Tax=Brevibacillus agri TaxID=51101 RepID=UPI001EE4F086|nr:hypothetical protein [Brevibacillus agri]MCG5253873.1 hypothetical protein [Brevibacillus agri]